MTSARMFSVVIVSVFFLMSGCGENKLTYVREVDFDFYCGKYAITLVPGFSEEILCRVRADRNLSEIIIRCQSPEGILCKVPSNVLDGKDEKFTVELKARKNAKPDVYDVTITVHAGGRTHKQTFRVKVVPLKIFSLTNYHPKDRTSSLAFGDTIAFTEGMPSLLYTIYVYSHYGYNGRVRFECFSPEGGTYCTFDPPSLEGIPPDTKRGIVFQVHSSLPPGLHYIKIKASTAHDDVYSEFIPIGIGSRNVRVSVQCKPFRCVVRKYGPMDIYVHCRIQNNAGIFVPPYVKCLNPDTYCRGNLSFMVMNPGEEQDLYLSLHPNLDECPDKVTIRLFYPGFSYTLRVNTE